MKRIEIIFILLAILISSIGMVSLLRPGFFLTDDGNSMIIRFSAFYEALRSGQFPVRFLSRLNFGYGYPVADFLYPLFMYIGALIKALGFSFVDTIKIIFGLSFISGAVFSFFWLKKLFDAKSAFVGSIIYSLFPYHLYDIYVRGSIGEVLSLGILPFVLWQIERRSTLWGSFGIFFLILSHNILAVLFLIFIILYGLIDIYVAKKRELPNYYAKLILVGLGLSSFFAIPAIFDLQYTVFSKTAVSDWSRYFIDFSLIGISTIVIFMTLVIFVLLKTIELRKHRLTVLMFMLGVGSVFLASSLSAFLWKLLPASFIQFPFRFLSLAIVPTAFLGATLIFVLKDSRQKIIAGVIVLILVLLSSKKFLAPSVLQNYPDSFYSTNQDTTTVKNEYMPKWVKKVPTNMASSKIVNLNGEEKINVTAITSNKMEFNTFLAEQRTILVNMVYFPGWNVYVNGRKSNIIYDDGFMSLRLNEGENKVLVKFEETPERLIADLISIFSLFALIILSIRNKMSKL